MLTTVLAFVVVLGVLVTVHEYGHYRVARWCGVKVLRFAVGFGRPLLRWQRGDTEYALCALPLGGYVKMLDEREGEVAAHERHLAFNTQPLPKRFAIVAAGPLCNLLLAVLIYAALAWHGVEEARALLAAPPPGSLAAQAGVPAGVEIAALRVQGARQDVRSLDDLRWRLMLAAVDRQDVDLLEAGPHGRAWRLPLAQGVLEGEGDGNGGADMLSHIGVGLPWMPALIEALVPGGVAERAGLQAGDRVLRIDGLEVADAADLHRRIAQHTDARPQQWQVQRAGETLVLHIAPRVQANSQGHDVGRVDVHLGAPPAMVLVQHGAASALRYGVQRTWQVAAMSLQGLWQMLRGSLSPRNLGGPLTIADYAGRSAQAGWMAFLGFLAFVSVSLGVLNLLPVPVLDGGHLMYYLWEGVTGRAVSEVWQQRMQTAGLALLGLLMATALFNDVARLLPR